VRNNSVYSTPPDLLAGFEGPAPNGRERKGGEREEKEGDERVNPKVKGKVREGGERGGNGERGE